MRLRLTCLLLGILLVPASASADFHKVDFSNGGSFGNGASSLFGIHSSIGLRELGPSVFLPRRLTIVVGDFSAQIGSHDGKPVTQFASLWGARYQLTPYGKNCNLFGQVLAGNVYQNDAKSADHNDGAVAFGVGFEAFGGAATTEKDNNKSIETHYGLGLRVQVDVITRPGSDRNDFVRASVGVVYRIARRH